MSEGLAPAAGQRTPRVSICPMSFERWVPDPVILARLVAELDIPMDEHECMLEAVDAVSHERFLKEVESDPRVREG